MANARQQAASRAAGYLSNSVLYGGGSRLGSRFNPPENPYGLSDKVGGAARSFINSSPDDDATQAWGRDFWSNAAIAGAKTEVDVNYMKELSPLALDFQDKSMGIASKYNIQEINAQGEQDYRRVDRASTAQERGYASQERQIAQAGEQERERVRNESKELDKRSAMYRRNIRDTGRNFYG